MIEVINLRKSFKFYNSPKDRLLERLFGSVRHTEHDVLKDISFRVEDGETLGILGRNGAGKSTLLKILTGVILRDSGEMSASGRVTALLELGTGFDPNLTGRANIEANGLLIGMSRDEIVARKESIIEFSELGRFIDQPVKTYSSGMVVRLAFSVAIHSRPDIFLVDEALSVGDGHFQQKCIRAMQEHRAQGGSIIFVSHDMNAVKMVCDRAIVLESGRLLVDADPDIAVNEYNKLLSGDEDQLETADGYGSGELKIIACDIVNEEGAKTQFASGDNVKVRLTIEASADVSGYSVGLMIRDRLGQDIYGTNAHYLGESLSIVQGQKSNCEFTFELRLAPGKYTVTLALHEGMDHTVICYHWWDNALQFEVAGINQSFFGGLTDLRAQFTEKR